MATFQLANLDARLVYLALQYHLARPGSELDPETKQPLAHGGLAEVAQALEPQLDQAVATIELSAYQHQRLFSAISGTLNELKTYPLLEPVPPERGGGRRSTVTGFDAVTGGEGLEGYRRIFLAGRIPRVIAPAAALAGRERGRGRGRRGDGGGNRGSNRGGRRWGHVGCLGATRAEEQNAGGSGERQPP